MMNFSCGRKRKVYDRNRPSPLIARSGQNQYLGHLLIASDVQ